MTTPPTLGAVTPTPAHAATIHVAVDFLESIRDGDGPETLAGYFHDDGVIEYPFAPPGAPERLEGRDAILKRFRKAVGVKEMHELTIHHVLPAADPEWAVVAFHFTATMKEAGDTFGNDYVAVAHVREGRMLLFREYFDSLIRQKHG